MSTQYGNPEVPTVHLIFITQVDYPMLIQNTVNLPYVLPASNRKLLLCLRQRQCKNCPLIAEAGQSASLKQSGHGREFMKSQDNTSSKLIAQPNGINRSQGVVGKYLFVDQKNNSFDRNDVIDKSALPLYAQEGTRL